MNEPYQIPRDQARVDANHLQLLSIFHFVAAALSLFGILFLIIHYTIFHTILTNPKMWENSKQAPPPAAFAQMFEIFKWFYLLGALWFICSGILNVISAFYLRTHKHRTFSLIVAGLNCVHLPLGTVLGIFTIIVLVRDSVRKAYHD